MISLFSVLVQSALPICEENGDQVEAIAALYGLCDWVRLCLDGKEHSLEMERMKSTKPEMFESVKDMMDEILRCSDHQGQVAESSMDIYKNAKKGWKKLANEFAHIDQEAKEVALYRSCGAEIAVVLHLADTSPQYMKSSGGAMVKMYFIDGPVEHN
mmetsp:Transcript_18116/g.22178  ORF Transcript_18116/g.22178 Transcript_18116/m.22178 type:complete len:157 (-) Transcript_18116:162-632(-)